MLYYLPNKLLPKPAVDWPADWPARVIDVEEGTQPVGYIATTEAGLAAIKSSLNAEKDIIQANHNATAAFLDLTAVTFEDLPAKMPHIAYELISAFDPTVVERKAIIRHLADFFTFIQAGHVALAVDELNNLEAPQGVDEAVWFSLVQQVNEMMIRNS